MLEAELKHSITDTLISLIWKDLEYISSAGLRVLLSAQKVMNKQGKMVVRNVNEDVRKYSDITGFIDILIDRSVFAYS